MDTERTSLGASSASSTAEEERPAEVEPESEPVVPEGEDDERLAAALRHIRGLEAAHLKEQCLMTEWAATATEAERELLSEVVQDAAFWGEVQRMTDEDMDALPADEDSVGTDERLRQMFRCFDKDNSGTIDSNELHQMLLYMGLPSTDRDVKAMMARADASGDGCIDMDEFLAVMKDAQGERLGSNDARTAAEAIKAMSHRLTQSAAAPST